MAHHLEDLVADESIVCVNVDNNFVLFAVLAHEEVHVGEGAQVLGCVNEGQPVFEPVLLVLQVLE